MTEKDPTFFFFRDLLRRDGFLLEEREDGFWLPCFSESCIVERRAGRSYLPTLFLDPRSGLIRCQACTFRASAVDYLKAADGLSEDMAMELVLRGRLAKKEYISNSRKSRLG